MPEIDIGWVDIGLAGFMLLSVLVGLMRGVVFEVLSLVGWFVSYIAARTLAPYAVPYVHIGPPGSVLNYMVTVSAVFVLVLLLWGVSARLVRTLIRATPLSPVDRLFGAGFGFLRGLVVLVIAALLIGASPWADAPPWRRSSGAKWLNALSHELRPIFLEQFPTPASVTHAAA